MAYQIFLNKIYEAAKNRKFNDVRELLNAGINYREAQLYCEMIKQDYEASKYILKQATCGCGQIVTKWIYGKTPICGSCNFQEAMNKIEYGKA